MMIAIGLTIISIIILFTLVIIYNKTWRHFSLPSTNKSSPLLPGRLEQESDNTEGPPSSISYFYIFLYKLLFQALFLMLLFWISHNMSPHLNDHMFGAIGVLFFFFTLWACSILFSFVLNYLFLKKSGVDNFPGPWIILSVAEGFLLMIVYFIAGSISS
ncbi:MAG TPA: hypothetical protein VM658_16185 [bacterium]|nr:hypothetical protein [bacterium]